MRLIVVAQVDCTLKVIEIWGSGWMVADGAIGR